MDAQKELAEMILNFTFQSGSIQMICSDAVISTVLNFTFQSGSIQILIHS